MRPRLLVVFGTETLPLQCMSVRGPLQTSFSQSLWFGIIDNEGVLCALMARLRLEAVFGCSPLPHWHRQTQGCPTSTSKIVGPILSLSAVLELYSTLLYSNGCTVPFSV